MRQNFEQQYVLCAVSHTKASLDAFSFDTVATYLKFDASACRGEHSRIIAGPVARGIYAMTPNNAVSAKVTRHGLRRTNNLLPTSPVRHVAMAGFEHGTDHQHVASSHLPEHSASSALWTRTLSKTVHDMKPAVSGGAPLCYYTGYTANSTTRCEIQQLQTPDPMAESSRSVTPYLCWSLGLSVL
jgi:hypothetical protein